MSALVPALFSASAYAGKPIPISHENFGQVACAHQLKRTQIELLGAALDGKPLEVRKWLKHGGVRFLPGATAHPNGLARLNEALLLEIGVEKFTQQLPPDINQEHGCTGEGCSLIDRIMAPQVPAKSPASEDPTVQDNQGAYNETSPRPDEFFDIRYFSPRQ